MRRPLPPSSAPAREPRADRRRRAGARGLVLASGLLAAALGCARPNAPLPSAEIVDRDRAEREVVVAEIERDHEKLADLISSERFEAPDSIYSDPELRGVALHLVEQARKLRRLADSDVLSPSAP